MDYLGYKMYFKNYLQKIDIIKEYCVLHFVALFLSPKNTSYLTCK